MGANKFSLPLQHRFQRLQPVRLRWDKLPSEADRLETLEAML